MSKNKKETASTREDDAHIFAASEEAPSEAPETSKIYFAPPDRFEPTLGNVRTDYDQVEVNGMAANIKDLRERGLGLGGTGILQAITVRLPDGIIDAQGRLKTRDFKWPIVYGTTRWQAGTRAGCDLLPYTISDLDENTAYELAFYENENRHDMAAIDKAIAMRRIMTNQKLSIRAMAARSGRDKSYVQDHLGLLKAAPDVLDILNVRPDAVTMVNRIDSVKEPKTRARLIEMMVDFVPIARIQKAIAEHNARLREESGASTRGERGLPIASRFNLEDALDSIHRHADQTLAQMQVATMDATQRRKLRTRLADVRGVMEQMEEFLSRKK
jgi:ParB/RepB/Spo0J family partition protein